MTDIPFAIGEEFSGIYVFAPFIERGLSNYVRLDGVQRRRIHGGAEGGREWRRRTIWT